ncbi:hypothetical protein ACWD4B_14745 [Streptomyces sp. NPDC002536]
MTDRAARRWASTRSVLALVLGVVVLGAGGVWLACATDRGSVMGEAPRTAAAQRAFSTQEVQVEVDESAAGELPGVRDCGGGTPVLEPKIITLDCASSGQVASGITWDEYGTGEATGNGVVQVSSGAGGAARTSFPARLRLTGPKRVDGTMAFTALEVTYTGATPTGEAHKVFTIA